MNCEKTITICGKEVKVRYCMASETGYERMSGNSASIFLPTDEKDEEGNVVTKPAKATTDDYVKLAVACIIAAYARDEKDEPVTSKDIMFDANPDEIINLINLVMELRGEWYSIPEVVNVEEEKAGDVKNA